MYACERQQEVQQHKQQNQCEHYPDCQSERFRLWQQADDVPGHTKYEQDHDQADEQGDHIGPFSCRRRRLPTVRSAGNCRQGIRSLRCDAVARHPEGRALQPKQATRPAQPE